METIAQDLVYEILSKLPAKSVLRFRCVSKSWYSLISNPLFVKSHLCQSYNNPSLILDYYGHRKTHPLDSAFNNLKLKYPNLLKYLSYRILSTCDGLVMVEFSFPLECKIPDTLVMICNPCTGESRQLHIPDFQVSDYYFRLWLGFGYDSSTGDYKVLQLAHYTSDQSPTSTVVRVLSLKSNTWRSTKITNEDISGTGLYLNGALHWGIYYLNLFKIVAFDLADEKFFELSCLQNECNCCSSLHEISVYKDCICICTYYKSVIDLRIMKEYGNPASWTNQRIDISSYVMRNLIIPEFQTEFRIWFVRDNTKLDYLDPYSNFSKFVSYDMEESEVMTLQTLKKFKSPQLSLSMFLYHETLVSPYPENFQPRGIEADS